LEVKAQITKTKSSAIQRRSVFCHGLRLNILRRVANRLRSVANMPEFYCRTEAQSRRDSWTIRNDKVV
jgi:hypothetical protein